MSDRLPSRSSCQSTDLGGRERTTDGAGGAGRAVGSEAGSSGGAPGLRFASRPSRVLSVHTGRIRTIATDKSARRAHSTTADTVRRGQVEVGHSHGDVHLPRAGHGHLAERVVLPGADLVDLERQRADLLLRLGELDRRRPGGKQRLPSRIAQRQRGLEVARASRQGGQLDGAGARPTAPPPRPPAVAAPRSRWSPPATARRGSPSRR